MSAINIDSLTFASTLESSFSDNSLANAASMPSAFGAFLQQAQSPPTGQSAASPSSLSNTTSNTDLGDPAASGQPSPTSFTPQAEAGAANQTATPEGDRWSQHRGHNRPSAEGNTAPTNSSQADSSSPSSNSDTAATTSQNNTDASGRQTGSGSSQAAPASSAGTVQEGNSKKPSPHASSGLTANASAALNAANASQTVQGSSSTVPSATPHANGNTNPGTTPSAANGNTPQTVSASAANTNGQTNGAQMTAPQTAVPTLVVSQTNPAVAAGATGIPASGPGATATAPSATNPSTAMINTPVQDATTANSANASTSEAIPAIPTLPAPGTPGAAKAGTANTQQSAVVGAGASSNGQSVDADNATAGPGGINATLATGISSAQEQRTVSAIDSLSASNSNDSASTTAARPSAASSTSTIAAPQTTATGTTPTNSGTSTATADTDLSQADRTRFVQRVEQAFQDLSGQGGSVRLRLSPPELGSLRIEISVAKGVMTARVEAETPSARNLLLDNLPALRERLAQQDIKVQRFDVDLMDRSGGGAFNQSSNYQNPSQQNAARSVAPVPARGSSESSVSVEATPSRPVGSNGRLNVVV